MDPSKLQASRIAQHRSIRFGEDAPMAEADAKSHEIDVADVVRRLKEEFPGASVVSIGGDTQENMRISIGKDDLTPVAEIACDIQWHDGMHEMVGYTVWNKGGIADMDGVVRRLRGELT